MGFLDALGGLFTGSTAQQAELARQAELNKAYEQYGQLAGQGREALTTNYTAALQPWMGLQQFGAGGTQAYAAATGALGPEAMEQAFANFRVSPGEQFAQLEAQRAIERSGVAGGAATGNILNQVAADTAGRARGAWQNYVGNLAPWLNYGQGVAGGVSNLYANLANQLGGTYSQQAAARMNLGQQLGQSAYNYEFAPTIGAQNLVNLGLQAGKVAASFANPIGAAAGSLMGGGGGYYGGSPETNPNLRPY